LISVFALAAREQGAHVHGTAKVDMAFDGKKGKIVMEMPGDTLFGFEHEARSAKDKATKAAALKKLDESIAKMVVLDPDLQCEIKKEFDEVNQEKDHSDIAIEFSVSCQKPVAGTSITFNFKKEFSRLKKVKVDVIVDTVQKSAEVTKNGESLELK
jgi:hypothetical protein